MDLTVISLPPNDAGGKLRRETTRRRKQSLVWEKRWEWRHWGEDAAGEAGAQLVPAVLLESIRSSRVSVCSIRGVYWSQGMPRGGETGSVTSKREALMKIHLVRSTIIFGNELHH